MKRDYSTSVQRMCEGDRRLNPVDVEPELVEERRCDTRWMDRGAYVMAESGKSQFPGACSPAHIVGSFNEENLPSRA
jgi:hypothetical protein